MFERQADSYILNHMALENASISPVGDFSQFDNADAPDDSELENLTIVSPHLLHNAFQFSDSSGTAPEELSILLPSSLGWQWCVDHHTQSLAEKEARLHVAQANDAIQSMCLALGFKSALFHSHVRPANSQRTKTRAWDTINSVDATVHLHARNYSMA